jgi:signal transduction histidine kinase
MRAAGSTQLRPRTSLVRNGSTRLRAIIPRITAGPRSFYLWIVAAAAIGVPGLLAYLGFRATEEWQRSTRLLVEQRTSEVVTLMIMALNRDMRAVQGEVLPQLESLNVRPAVYDLSDEVTTAFARFPYPESFFTWTAGGSRGGFYVFTRSDRPPPWYNESAGARRVPTMILKDPPELHPLLRLLQSTALTGSHVLALETTLHGDTYQIVARARYGFRFGAGTESIVGFLVNLSWVREHYFSELLTQLSNVLAPDSAISMAIFDERGRLVTSTPAVPPAKKGLPSREQHFPLLFFDPLLRTAVGHQIVPNRYWMARAQPFQGESMLVAARGSRRTFVLIAITALAAGVALFFAIISVRAAAALAAMKSEFVSSVTHELKTPLASIRLASETLVRGRYHSCDVIVQYAELLLNEVSRLTRTIDNLLSITRVQDVSGFYLFESVDLSTLVEEALSRFNLQLREQGFEVQLDVPASLPHVHADRTAVLQVLENLLDNAIRYSNRNRFLGVSGSSSGRRVHLQIADKGPGIASDELPRVFDKFFRGRRTSSAGSGLGLAIAERILKDHGGMIRLHSVEGLGTTAEVILPVAHQAGEGVNETKDSCCRG